MFTERGYLAAFSFGFDRDEEMASHFLDPLNPQSEYSEALLALVTTSGLSEPGYVERLERHYDRVKRAATTLGILRKDPSPSLMRSAENRHLTQGGMRV